MMTRCAPRVVFILAIAACARDATPVFSPPPIVSRAVVTGRVTAPSGAGVPAQLVYVYSDFTTSCGPSPTQLGFMRTNAAGVYLFDRVVAPTERDGVCVTVVVRPEASTGYTELPRQGYVSFRFLPPVDTLRVDVGLMSSH